jgi:uncharacterized protein YkwD/uncharacterized membrane protein required for colicin V production
MSTLPSLNGNWVDLFVVIIFLFYVFDGLRRGLILGLLDLVGFLLSFFSAVNFYSLATGILTANFNLPLGISNALGFLLVGFLSEVIFSLITHKIINFIPDNFKRSKIQNLLGIIPAIGNTAIISAFILTLVVILPVQGSIKSSIVTSKLGGFLVSKTQGVEKNLNRIFGGAIEESLTFLTVKPESQETVDLNFTQKNLTIDPIAEIEMLALINQERKKAGVGELAFDTGKLHEVARAHAKDMFEKGYFSHINLDGESPFDRMDKAGVKYLTAGENLALAPSLSLAHQGLMNSPGHRANILSPDFNKIAIGVIDGGIYGKMFVQEFTN